LKNCFTVVRKDKICCQGRDSKHIILLNDKSSFFKCSCTCMYFVKSAVCAHLVAYSSLNDLFKQDDLNLKLTDTLEIDSNHSKSSESMQISINSTNEWVKPNEKSIDEEDETINPENLLSSTKMPSPQAKKSVRIRKKFSEVKIFASLLNLDCFVRESNEFSIVITHSNNVNCTQCTTNDKEHKMSVIYRKCKCNKKECSLSYKLTNCKKRIKLDFVSKR
jgi:hypothetical protein